MASEEQRVLEVLDMLRSNPQLLDQMAADLGQRAPAPDISQGFPQMRLGEGDVTRNAPPPPPFLGQPGSEASTSAVVGAGGASPPAPSVPAPPAPAPEPPSPADAISKIFATAALPPRRTQAAPTGAGPSLGGGSPLFKGFSQPQVRDPQEVLTLAQLLAGRR